MYRRSLFLRLALALVLLVILFAGGAALYRIGWSQGYQAYALSAAVQGNEASPQIPPYAFYQPGYFWPWHGFPFFFAPFGLCFGIGFFLLIFFLIGGVFRRWNRWNWRGGPGSGYWGPGKGGSDQQQATTDQVKEGYL
jgi:hypothetical protein